MALSVAEKQHWKDRIARRIDHAIEGLQATHDPGFFERVRKQADEEAWSSLGLMALRGECAHIDREIDRLRDRQREAWTEMLSHISGTPVKDLNQPYAQPQEVCAAHKRRKAVHEREILQETPLGQQILRLLEEKEELLDTVWLATSPSQIKELWSRFAELLNWEPPKLQQEALSIAPVSDES